MRTSIKSLVIALILTTWWACDSPSAPSRALLDVVITGPELVAPGATAQYTATARYSGGSTEDVTAKAAWHSTQPQVLRFDQGGTGIAGSRGEATITAEFEHVRRPRVVFVLESGTYRLTGRIKESGQVLAGARIDVISGTGTGLSATSDSGGLYALYGVAGSIQLRLSAPGFTERLVDVAVISHTRLDYELTPLAASADMTGEWHLTLAASPTCSGTLPEAVRRREYDVAISQNNSRLTVTFSSPTLFSRQSVEGRVFADAFSLTLWYDDYYGEYSLLDRVSAVDWVGIRGSLQGTTTASAVQGAFSGAFDYYLTAADARSPGRRSVTCAADPSFELQRR